MRMLKIILTRFAPEYDMSLGELSAIANVSIGVVEVNAIGVGIIHRVAGILTQTLYLIFP